MRIGGRTIGGDSPTFVVAEISANHLQNLDLAVELVRKAKEVGADAVKLQTYTPDTLTLASAKSSFKIRGGTPWDGRTLHELYEEAYMPWEWQPKLQQVAKDEELIFFSTAFDETAVDFLQGIDVPCFKIASFEIVDIPLIEKVAETGKPLIISTGMATHEEIQEAIQAARRAGAKEIALLKCTSAYPAPPEEMNIRTIPRMIKDFRVPVGLSDHTLESSVAIAAVALGACIVEKHLTLSRRTAGADNSFSSEPREFEEMVNAIRMVEKSLGEARYGPTNNEQKSLVFRRSLYVVKNLKAGAEFTRENVRSIRPSDGLPPRFLDQVLGRKAAKNIESDTPLSWSLVA